MKRILGSLLVIVVSILIFASCSGNKVLNTEMKNKEYTAVGKLFCESSLSATKEDETTLNTVMVKKEFVTYDEMLTSNAFLENVSTDTGKEYTLDELRDMISMTYEEDNILAVNVTADTSEDALVICKSILSLAPEFVSEISHGTIKVLDDAHITD